MEKKIPISKNKKFIYSITYQYTDEESSELGEYKEIGFEVEKSTDTIGKILKLSNENYNIYYPISVGNWESTSPIEDRDYWEKGIHKFYVLHINNEDGTSISEEENNFITYLLSNGQYNSEEFEEFYLGGLIIGGLIGGYIGYYYGKNPRKKYDFGGEVVGKEVTYNYYGEEQKGDILEVLDDTALVVQTGFNKRLVEGSDVLKIHNKNTFKAGGKIDEFDFDEKMALINLDMCYEYSVKLDKMVSEDTKLEDWVKMKLTIVEQNIAGVKHALEGWEKFGEGGMIFKKQLLHIAKYSKELIEMIQKGSRLMSWQENKLAESSTMIDSIYHHLDYEFGNRASNLKKEKYAHGGEASRFVYDYYEVYDESTGISLMIFAINQEDAENIAEELDFESFEDGDYYNPNEDEYFASGGAVYYNGMSKEEILSKTIVYDNQGETLDRYTIFTPDGSVFGMSENASGFNQYIGDETEIEKGKHLGKKLTSVPKDIQLAVLDRMIEEYADGGFVEEVVTKPKVAPTPVTTPKPNTDNPYKPKTKTPPKAKYDFLLLNK